MRLLRWSAWSVLLALLVLTGHPRAAGEATFHAGMTGGSVRDATKVGSTIYAVGTWANPAANGRIDGALWTIDAATSAVSQTPLPDFCAPATPVPPPGVPCSQNLSAGLAITPDAAYIASQARTSTIPTTAVKVTTNVLPTPAPPTNLDLTPASSFPVTNYAGNGRQASAVSDDGVVLYGQLNAWLGLTNPNGTKIFQPRAYRFDGSGAVAIYPQAATAGGFTTSQSVLGRGASSNGDVVVGQTSTSAPVVDSQAFRYVHGTGVFNIPRLTGGTWNSPFALNDAGNIIALVGDSSAYSREAYIHDRRALPPVITPLGAPNTQMNFSSLGGITNDGAVVAGTALAPTTPQSSADRYGYFHNSHGWFHLTSALRDAGVDLSGWVRLAIAGMNGTGTMLWGGGLHNGAQEGFVAEFAPGYLENYNPTATAPGDPSIVGVWALGGTYPVDPAHPEGILAFLADGTYFDIEPDGFERGFYTFDGTTATFLTLVDTNGRSGVSDDNAAPREVLIDGNQLLSRPGCTPGDDDCGFATRITGTPDSLIGGWIGGDPTQNDASAIFVLTAGGKFFLAEDGDNHALTGGRDGIEIGQATWDQVTHVVTPTSFDVDTNGDWGLSHAFGSVMATPAVGGMSLEIGDDSGSSTVTRIIDPATVAVFTGDSIQGVLGLPFSYQVNASGALGYGATGLPDGLTINSITGEISGTPSGVGVFPVGVFATNFGGAIVNLTITAPVVVPVPEGTAVPVTPEVPEGTPPIEMTFDAVGPGGGTTTVAVVDPATAPDPDIPGNFQIAVGDGGTPFYYEITTTAPFTGAVEICFSYAGVDFRTLTPRLLHFDDTVLPSGEWVDITTSVDSVAQILCGETTSFSPFVIVTSEASFVSGKGFYAPVSPLASFVNTAKAGSTVPLKFNVYVNGVEEIDATSLELEFSVAPSTACTNAPEDQVDYVTQENTNLRYDASAGHFILNWKTPRTPGCFSARVTNKKVVGLNGLDLSAIFNLK